MMIPIHKTELMVKSGVQLERPEQNQDYNSRFHHFHVSWAHSMAVAWKKPSINKRGSYIFTHEGKRALKLSVISSLVLRSISWFHRKG